MVQVAPLIGAVIVAITSVAQAGACTPGLIYCGSTLSRLGKKEEAAAFLLRSQSEFKANFKGA